MLTLKEFIYSYNHPKIETYDDYKAYRWTPTYNPLEDDYFEICEIKHLPKKIVAVMHAVFNKIQYVLRIIKRKYHISWNGEWYLEQA